MNTFHKDLQDSLICSSCKKYKQDLFTQCANGHSVCTDCKSNLKKCVECGEALTSVCFEDITEGPSNEEEPEMTSSLPVVPWKKPERNSRITQPIEMHEVTFTSDGRFKWRLQINLGTPNNPDIWHTYTGKGYTHLVKERAVPSVASHHQRIETLKQKMLSSIAKIQKGCVNCKKKQVDPSTTCKDGLCDCYDFKSKQKMCPCHKRFDSKIEAFMKRTVSQAAFRYMKLKAVRRPY
ncbi:uncharacterized protein [Periplaneta americana]|uniref:uncharacterized protein n=1 Tax=Periplaneta americana TaxID=6978 RepID=UPI0037E9A32D